LERNEPEALNLAGLCYEYGVGAAKNPARAVSAYRAAAELGYCVAQRNLGNCLDEGEGVERDHKEAIAWYERAAAQDYPIAICSLAFSYERGTRRRGVAAAAAHAS
jgi:TPR repeat protein